MSTQPGLSRTYTIREVAKLTGLAESNLRYYETIGLIPEIRRDVSSKYRVYSEEDVNYVVSIACLSATGMSIENMRIYLGNRTSGAHASEEQIRLLEKQRAKLLEEMHFMQLRQRYIDAKIECWCQGRRTREPIEN